MKIGYSTFAMEPIPLVEALTGLAEIGYEALEIAAIPGRPEAPGRLSESARKRLKGLLRKVKFPPPVIMTDAHPCVAGDDRAEMLKHFDEVCRLAADLNFKKTPPVVTCAPPEDTEVEWPVEAQQLKSMLVELADIAKGHGAVYAARPVANSILETPDGIMTFLQEMNHPNLKLNFDVGLFAANGLDPEECIKACRSQMAYGLVKDCVNLTDEVEFMLPGDGDFDYPSYMVALNEVKYRGIICVEVSAAIYESEGYEPWDAAEYCFDVLSEAREVAEMGWG